jgi:hypothetical protein
MNVGRELAAFVLVAEKVSGNGKDGAESLYRNVPSGADYLDMSVYGTRDLSLQGLLTPNTMPRGNMMPQAMLCIRMCIHSIESMGSADIACPSSILSLWWSCANTVVLRSSATAAPALIL